MVYGFGSYLNGLYFQFNGWSELRMGVKDKQYLRSHIRLPNVWIRYTFYPTKANQKVSYDFCSLCMYTNRTSTYFYLYNTYLFIILSTCIYTKRLSIMSIPNLYMLYIFMEPLLQKVCRGHGEISTQVLIHYNVSQRLLVSCSIAPTC